MISNGRDLYEMELAEISSGFATGDDKWKVLSLRTTTRGEDRCDSPSSNPPDAVWNNNAIAGIGKQVFMWFEERDSASRVFVLVIGDCWSW